MNLNVVVDTVGGINLNIPGVGYFIGAGTGAFAGVFGGSGKFSK